MSEESIELVEDRQSKVVALYVKGLTQEEIAKELDISQPTVSRDLGEVRRQSRRAVEQQVTEDALFEFSRWTAGLDQIARAAWKMAEDQDARPESKMKALEFLKRCYDARLHTLLGTHPEGMNAQHHVIDMRFRKSAYQPDLPFGREEN